MFLRFFGVIFSKKIGDFSDFFERFRVATASCPADGEKFLSRTAPAKQRFAGLLVRGQRMFLSRTAPAKQRFAGLLVRGQRMFLSRQANKTPCGRASAA